MPKHVYVVVKCSSAVTPLNLSYQTGFEFKKQRAIPVITGIVVASEQEDVVLEVRYKDAVLLHC